MDIKNGQTWLKRIHKRADWKSNGVWNPEELIALAKAEGIEITKEQAEAYLEELKDIELDPEALDKVAGGSKKGGNFTFFDACYSD